MNPKARVLILPFAVVLALGGVLWAGSAGPDQDPTVAKPPVTAPPPAAGETADEKPKRFGDVKEVTKDMQTLEGLLTLYRYDPTDKERDPEKLLCKIPKNLLGQDMLFATSISSGGFFTNWMWTTHLIRWDIVGRHVRIVTPDVRYVQQKDQPVTDVVQRTYPDQYLAAVPIVAMTPNGDPLVDFGELLKSNIADVPGGGRLRADLSQWTKVKVFPDNVLIGVNLAVGGAQGDLVGLSYSFRRLPTLGSYKPRAADDRVGYFLTARMDWAKNWSERDTFDRYVNRWNLEKQDASLELSPPKEPIVFIIEKTVPIRWRRWVREGILDWNKAFEKIGYVDAVVVQQQAEDNEYADYDPEDARYNFFRWGVSGNAYAVGPSRTDPRTGQILDADIVFDDAFIRVWMRQLDVFAPGSPAEGKGEAFRRWAELYPELVPPLLKQRPEELAEAALAPPPDVLATLRGHEGHLCYYAAGMRHQLAVLHSALLATGTGEKKVPERLIGEALRETVTHEVGHTLGLRHNFKASSWLTMAEIVSRRNETDGPLSSSVMDYNPLLFFADDNCDDVRHFCTPTIGPYDEWAVEYGYRAPGKGEDEEKLLREIASRCTRPELAYATDEDTSWVYSPDPLVNRYDMSASPVDWAESRIALCDRLLSNINEWALQEGDPRYYLTQAFNTLWFEKARNFEFVARLVGGQYFSRDHQGDPDCRPAFQPVAADEQRRALKLLRETVFNRSFFDVSPEILNNLSVSRWSHWGAGAPARLDYPLHDRIAMLQVWTLLDLLAPPVLTRLYDAELKCTGDDKFTAAELLRGVRDQIWSELDDAPDGPYSDGKPFLHSLERNLQRQHLDILLAAAQASPGGAVPTDVQAMIRMTLRELSERIGRTLKAGDKLDFASRAHLTECQSRIDRVLEAHFLAR